VTLHSWSAEETKYKDVIWFNIKLVMSKFYNKCEYTEKKYHTEFTRVSYMALNLKGFDFVA
jgi:hypothetical protein